jgi:hypothetical protein
MQKTDRKTKLLMFLIITVFIVSLTSADMHFILSSLGAVFTMFWFYSNPKLLSENINFNFFQQNILQTKNIFCLFAGLIIFCCAFTY